MRNCIGIIENTENAANNEKNENHDMKYLLV
jgi:hypothetical protein